VPYQQAGYSHHGFLLALSGISQTSKAKLAPRPHRTESAASGGSNRGVAVHIESTSSRLKRPTRIAAIAISKNLTICAAACGSAFA
jgi:hypothetical protein